VHTPSSRCHYGGTSPAVSPTDSSMLLLQVLQDSLGGEAKTLMYVQVSPSSPDAAETLCTLNFANRARATDLGTKGTKDTSASLSVRPRPTR
jgi:hypothetical protein